MSFEKEIKSISLEEIESFMADKANLLSFRPKVEIIGNINNLNSDQLIELVRKLDAWGYDDITIDGDISTTLNRAVFMMQVLGLNETAMAFEYIINYAMLLKKFSPIIDEVKFNNKLSIKNSNIASGPKNKLYDEIISIMILTWKKHPFASKNRMIKKIVEHFGEERISRPTLDRWIKINKLGPEMVVRPAPEFSLVIPS